MSLWGLRDNSYQRFDDRVGSNLPADQKRTSLVAPKRTLVAYGWRDLEALTARLAEGP
jgi:hypothetical protein